ncbi:MAG: hypothetical protein JU82_09310 [Sulfuricurvum sp. MLSB]|uniref:hypothetical protein n=1 Tax=Sulfuricurvum sp. MLSB TaxID=1537917 RepID=UPI000504BE25|nr:hypothetical protein [Sulfuricurvum sp. MLSB]KFN38937.1 MAG: hypothetical protein JU82_09310 [Sulfuricurvum sp. MLSB]
MNGFVDSAVAACLEVRKAINEESATLFASHERGFGGDVSSGIDLRAEAICYRHLSSYGSVFSEEAGWMDPKSAINIILDPIDGSDNCLSCCVQSCQRRSVRSHGE